MTGPIVRVAPDAEALAGLAAGEVARCAAAALRARGRFTLALSGGATPRLLYRALADPEQPFREQVAWRAVHVLFGDERCVPPDHPASNYRAAREELLDRVPLGPGHLHRMRGEEADRDAAARRYEAELRAIAGGAAWPVLDLVLLGMGEDGHTASLFPGSPALEERQRAVVAVRAPALPAERLTLTLPALTAAREVLFLVAGAHKAARVAEALADPPAALPAARVRPVAGELLWLLDAGAAARLPSG